MLGSVPGARLKRGVLTWLGRRDARRQRAVGFPGNDWLAGITNPPCVADPLFLERWLSQVPGRVVELACHPGHWDLTLVGRDCRAADAALQRRVHEFHRLTEPGFATVCRRAGFILVAPSRLSEVREASPHAA